MPATTETSAAPDWLQPPVEQAGLGVYVQVLRERLWMVLVAVAVTMVAAVAYLLTADEVYEASADVLVSPVSSDDELLVSLGLIRSSNDPTRDIETATRLADNLDVATVAAAQLESDASPRAVLRRVDVAPVASSNVMAVTARGPTPDEAATLANVFANAFIEDRTNELREQIDNVLPRLRTRADAEAAGRTAPDTGVLTEETTASQIARLELLRSENDPTLQVVTEAVPPTSQTSPKPTLTLIAALIGGLILGAGAAFAARALDPRLRREEQLRARYRLPILTRVPREPARRRGQPLVPGVISPAAQEAYRALRANVTASQRGSRGAHSVMITGTAPAEGKTTTAINLATTFALAGQKVILIEADLRRPTIAKALGVRVKHGVVGALLEDVPFEQALVTTPTLGPSLHMLLADYEGGWISELFSLHAAQQLVDEAKQLADIVVVDSPPLTAVVDTLPLARQVDDLVIVARLGLTRLDKLRELGELLGSNDIRPLGFALLGTEAPEAGYYYQRTAGGPTAARAGRENAAAAERAGSRTATVR